MIRMVACSNLSAFLAAAVAMVAGSHGLGAQPHDPGPPTERRMTSGQTPDSVAARADMVPLPGDEYPMGHPDARASARPAHRVAVQPFAIDRTEVTNAQYAEFLNALNLEVRADFRHTTAERAHFGPETWPHLLEEGRDAELHPLIGLDDAEARIEVRGGRFVAAEGYASHPVAETTWRGARDYCRWRGARLPTEAEWEAAARGTAGRRYPWGDAPPTDARVYAGHPSGVTAAVGSHPAGATPDGIQDLAGSLAEWTASLYRPYPYEAGDGRNAPAAAGERVTRGGDYVFDTEPDKLTGFFREGFSRAPQDGHRHIGFRCAADR